MDAPLSFLDDIKRYVAFTDGDSERLLGLFDVLSPHFDPIAEHFYQCILAHPNAHAAITGGDEQVERLKRTLVSWMHSGLKGPHDEDFFERRAKIGQVHVRIGLPQQYMVTAMNVMRIDYRNVLEQSRNDLHEFAADCAAVDRLFDIELAIMFQTYQADSEDRMRRRERLATIGQLAASIGHDLRNPLGVIESSLFIMRRKNDANEVLLRHVDKIAKQVRTCERIVTDLLDMAKNNPPRLKMVDIREVIEQCLEQVNCPRTIEIHIDAPPIQFVLDPGLIGQALVNLLTNSIRAIGSATPGQISIIARTTAEELKLTVEDTGPGFEPAILPLAFEPLVTTRATGIGLGLALVKSIVERHQGQVRGQNRNEGGASVDMVLPRLTLDPEP